jgi:hypothetical protein
LGDGLVAVPLWKIQNKNIEEGQRYTSLNSSLSLSFFSLSPTVLGLV